MEAVPYARMCNRLYLTILYLDISQDSLECGTYYNCCSPYWKMCIKDNDCCNSNHVCRPADGFDYDRCLWPSAANRHSPWLSPLLLLSLFLSSALAQWYSAPSLTDVFLSCKANILFSLSALVYVAVYCVGGDISYGAVG